MMVVSLFLLACGAALILNTVVARRSSNRSPFRPENVDESGRGLKRMLPISLGAFLLLAGVAMLFAPP